MPLNPQEISQNYDTEVALWLPQCHTNYEVCRTLARLDEEFARKIYQCCREKPEYLEHYLQNETVISRLLPAMLGAFSTKCAVCGCDVTALTEIRAALLLAKRNSVMFPMADLDGWYRSVEERIRECPKRHGFFEVWKLLRALKVKVAAPQPAKLETEYYE
jgi:hypothetical protein